MDLFIDLDTHEIRTSSGAGAALVSTIDAKRARGNPFAIYFVRFGLVNELPAATQFVFGIKPRDGLAGEYLVRSTDFQKARAAGGAKYTVDPEWDTVQLAEAFAAAKESATLALYLEIQWTIPGSRPASTPLVPCLVQNSLNRGNESAPAASIPPYPPADRIALKNALGSAAAADTTDFATAEQGAKAASAVQPGDLAAVAESGNYADLQDLPDNACVHRVADRAALGDTAAWKNGDVLVEAAKAAIAATVILQVDGSPLAYNPPCVSSVGIARIIGMASVPSDAGQGCAVLHIKTWALYVNVDVNTDVAYVSTSVTDNALNILVPPGTSSDDICASISQNIGGVSVGGSAYSLTYSSEGLDADGKNINTLSITLSSDQDTVNSVSGICGAISAGWFTPPQSAAFEHYEVLQPLIHLDENQTLTATLTSSAAKSYFSPEDTVSALLASSGVLVGVTATNLGNGRIKLVVDPVAYPDSPAFFSQLRLGVSFDAYENGSSCNTRGSAGQIYLVGSPYLGVPPIPTKVFLVADTTLLGSDAALLYLRPTSVDAIPVDSVAGRRGAVVLTCADVGLDRVENTNDYEKPISNAANTALNLKGARVTYYTYKSASTTVRNSTTLINDSVISISLPAGVYLYELYLIVQSTTATPGFKFRLINQTNGTTTTTVNPPWVNVTILPSPGATVVALNSITAGPVYNCPTAVVIPGATMGIQSVIIVKGIIGNSASQYLTLQWAQATATAEDTKLLLGSYLNCTKK